MTEWMTWGLFSGEKLNYKRAFRITPMRNFVQSLVRDSKQQWPKQDRDLFSSHMINHLQAGQAGMGILQGLRSWNLSSALPSSAHDVHLQDHLMSERWMLELHPSNSYPRDKERRIGGKGKGVLAELTPLNSFPKIPPNHCHWPLISHPHLQGRLGNVFLLARYMVPPT